jgi:hypothetical protein
MEEEMQNLQVSIWPYELYSSIGCLSSPKHICYRNKNVDIKLTAHDAFLE